MHRLTTPITSYDANHSCIVLRRQSRLTTPIIRASSYDANHVLRRQSFMHRLTTSIIRLSSYDANHSCIVLRRRPVIVNSVESLSELRSAVMAV